jgi:predicted dehydrogenase
MDVLILGASRIAAKRVMPALLRMPDVRQIHVASRREIDPAFIPLEKRGRIFRGYAEGLQQFSEGLVYVSLPNSLHGEWTERALDRAFHVIVDKPAFTTLATAKVMLELAHKRGACLAEVNVWSYHPQIDLARCIFEDADQVPTHVSAVFSFPPLDPGDFRYAPALGGGSLFDLGPYAVSCGRVFFSAPPTEITCRVLSRQNGGVDTSFSLLACFAGGKALVGHFGFTTEYRNALSLLGPGVAVEITRAFTASGEMELELRVRRNNSVSTLTAPTADAFQRFFERVFTDIQRGEWSRFPQALLADAECLHRLRASAGAL